MMDIANFFERKKRELSSNNLTQEKASQENPDDSIGLKTRFFTRIKITKMCESINCLQNLETETKSIKEISPAAKDWQIKGTEQLNDMNKAMNFINEKFEEFEKELKKKEEEIKHLDKRFDKMDAVVVHGSVEETVEDTGKKIINHYNQAWTKQLNLSILIDHTDLASLSSQKMLNLVQ